MEARCNPDPVLCTVQVYDEIAAEYAATWFDDPVMEPTLERFLSRLHEPWDILDAGCGPGRDVLAMARRGYRAVGVDLSRGMITEARTRVPDQVFRRMDLRRLQYPAESFQGIWACASLHHLSGDGAEGALAEFMRVLVPGGILAVDVEAGRGERSDRLGRFAKLYEPAELRELVAKAGFRILEEEQQHTDKTTLGGRRPRTCLHVLAEKTRSHDLAGGGPEDESLCVFCPGSRFELVRELPRTGVESILWGDQNFWVVPDIAPLVEGHLLMISTPHYPCFGDWPADLESELYSARDRIRDLLAEAYGEPVLFLEHGAVRPKSAGVCIDHSHWHCLPTRLPVRREVELKLGAGQPASLAELRRLSHARQPYIYLEEGPDRSWVYPVGDLLSQFLRQVVSSLQGQTVWRWQAASDLDAVQLTRRATLDRLLPLTDEHLLRRSEAYG